MAESLDLLDTTAGSSGKPGTPARLDGRTIEWDRLEMQQADNPPVPFSTLTDQITVPQIDCGITRTNSRTHAIIRDNVHPFSDVFRAD